MICLALEGLACVAEGAVADGMRRLDEATTAAVAGEIADVRLAETICCHLIDACQRVRDFDRAGEWCLRLEELSGRYGDAEMFTTCRTHYAEVLVWRGEWAQAGTTLVAACRDLAAVPRKAAGGLVRLAELRRRQGRPAEANAPARPGRRPPGRRRRARRARARRGRRARRRRGRRAVPAARGRGRPLRARPRARAARARAARDGRPRRRRPAVAELEATAGAVGTPPLRAAALLARGRLEAAPTAGGPARDAAAVPGHGGPARDAAAVPGHGGPARDAAAVPGHGGRATRPRFRTGPSA